eukprot:SAG31_NODE_736_length_12477_cov_60.959363_6_plen_35_part_00
MSPNVEITEMIFRRKFCALALVSAVRFATRRSVA